MKIEYIMKNGVKVAAISSEEVLIDSVNAALDLVMSIQYDGNTGRIAIDKKAIDEKFFVLSSGLAGEILQKFINYHVKFAVYGDYSKYTSKPLKDFIYEANQGKEVFFVDTKENAVKRLSEV